MNNNIVVDLHSKLFLCIAGEEQEAAAREGDHLAARHPHARPLHRGDFHGGLHLQVRFYSLILRFRLPHLILLM